MPRASVKTASWLPASGGVREDVDDEVAERRHRGTLPPPRAYRLRPWRTRSSSPTSRSPTATSRRFGESASRSPRARSSACSGRTARARRRPSRSSRATGGATAATATVLGFDPGAAPRELRERMGVVLQQSEFSPLLTVRETHRLFAGYFASPRDVDEVDRARRSGREARRPRQDALGRAEAAARPRRRARREPRARLPRRAHDGLRPGRATGRVGADPLAPLARHDDPAHDPLPRRGAAARRSRRRAPRRRDRPSRVRPPT